MSQKYIDALNRVRENQDAYRQLGKELIEHCVDGVRRLLERGYKGRIDFLSIPGGEVPGIYKYFFEDGKTFMECNLSYVDRNDVDRREITPEGLGQVFDYLFDEELENGFFKVIQEIDNALNSDTS